MSKNMPTFALVAALFGGSFASAQLTVDGTLDGAYGSPIVVQQVQTQFGDMMLPGIPGGSELNAAYAQVDGDRLYVMLTGNHEQNFNKLEIFIDSVTGGENVLSAEPEYDFLLDVGGTDERWNSSHLGGMTFDTGFEADYHMYIRGGNGIYEADFIDRKGGDNDTFLASASGNNPSGGQAGLYIVDEGNDVLGEAAGFIPAGSAGLPVGDVIAGQPATFGNGAALTEDLLFAVNNRNQAGVAGGTQAADTAAAAAVTTGIEFSVALADIGVSLDDGEQTIKISAMINNPDHSYLSNQFLGPLEPNPISDPAEQGNLGGDGAGGFTGTLADIDLNLFSGNQYFEITVGGSSFLSADFNMDGTVDLLDLDILGANWQMLGTATTGDANGDGTVDLLDLDILGAQWQQSSSFAEALSASGLVPEPGSLALLSVGSVLIARRRR